MVQADIYMLLGGKGLKYGHHAMSSWLEIQNLAPDGVTVFFVRCPG
jgi:hypothetical protein